MPYLRQSGDTSPEDYDRNSIAVIGLSCRFPGDASTPERFWELLCKGRSTQTPIPESRFNVDAFHHPTKGRLNTTFTKSGHFIAQDVAAFDAAFFNITQAEAQAMDPQQRMIMEVAYEAFENAGLPIETIAGTETGCFVGSFTNDYREMLFRDAEAAPRYAGTGAGSELLSNRLSWFYDLRGPSMTLGTACSSSLVAIHQACQSIRNGESEMAIAGGVNILLNPDMFMMLSNQQFLAPDGLCKSFDEKGDGYSRGEGVAVVVLKPISDAIRDGDTIRAVIRGTGVNQDGKTKGITVPSAEAQAQLIRTTYASAGLGFHDTHYFEAHGTGTKAGDPLEARAISQTLGAVREKGNNILIGSVKSNIGHLEACAGLAGLIKGIYILESGVIPANIHFKTGNPKIPFDEWRVKVPTKQTVWPHPGLRRLSVNSFGYGGTNAHAILDDAYHYLLERGYKANHNTIEKPTISQVRVPRFPKKQIVSGLSEYNLKEKPNRRNVPKVPKLFVFSAQDQDGLNRLRAAYSAHLQAHVLALKGDLSNENAYLQDLAFTLSTRRSRLPWKLSLVASSIEELIQGLSDKHEGASLRSTRVPKVGFVFTGQGAQWAEMGEELYHYKVFRKSIEDADQYLKSALGCTWSASEELRRPESESSINLPEYSQAICTILQVALVDLLGSWNITPASVIGHSSGEIAAAYCLGALSKEDAWKLAYYRGTLASQMKHIAPDIEGAMMAAGCSEDDAWEWISKISQGEIVVACVNSPSSVTISGDKSGINELESMLKEQGIFARKLKVETAYHSPHMSVISTQYLQEIMDIEIKEPIAGRKMHSSVTGGYIHHSELGPANWVRNLLSTVQFSDALHDLLRPYTTSGERTSENAVDVLVEIGPHSALQGPANQVMKKYGITGVDYRSVLSRKQNGMLTTLACAGALIAHGASVIIGQVNNSDGDTIEVHGRSLTDLPPYSWNHGKTFWGESRFAKHYRLRDHPRLPLIGAPVATINENEHTWSGFIRVEDEPWIGDHMIQSSILYPAAGYIAMVVEGARQMADATRVVKSFTLRDIQITAAIVLTEEDAVECILQIRPHLIGTRDSVGSTWLEFNISSCADKIDVRQNCSGLLLIEYQSAEDSDMSFETDLEDQRSRERYLQSERDCTTLESPVDFYRELSSLGLSYGNTFQNLTKILKGVGESCCTVTVPDTGSITVPRPSGRPHIIHPATLDAMFHTTFAALKGSKGQLDTAMVPKSIDEVRISAEIPYEIGTEFRGYSTAAKHGFKELMADLQMLSGPTNDPTVEIKGFCCAEISGMGKLRDDDSEGSAKKLCAQMIWKPTIELLSGEEVLDLIKPKNPDAMTVDEVILAEKSEMLAFEFIQTALKQVSLDDVPTPNLKNLYLWMKSQEASVLSSHGHRLRADNSDWLPTHEKSPGNIRAEVDASSLEGQALCKVGPVLENVLQGFLSQDELLTEKNLSSHVLTDMKGMKECQTKLKHYIDLLAHANPDLKILELGNGSIETASAVLSLRNSDLFNYTLTNKDSSEVEAAKAKLQTKGMSVHAKVFDIELDSSKQGFDDLTFDIIIAPNSLYTAHKLDKALASALKLLKPGGKLCLIELTNPGLRLGVVLNCLPGWLKEQDSLSSHMKASEWDGFLKQNHFSLDYITTDFEDPRHQQLSLIVATADGPSEKDKAHDEIIILESSNRTHKSESIATHLVRQLEQFSIKTERVKWTGDVSSLSGKRCISLMEIETSFLEDMAANDFLAMKKLILQTSRLLWVTAQSTPSQGLVVGLARSITNEIASLQFSTLQVSPTSLEAPEKAASLIAKLATVTSNDNEFLEEGGLIKVSRATEDAPLNEKVSVDEGKIDLITLSAAVGAQKLGVQSPGMLDSLCFEPDEVAATDLKDDEVEIQVKATGLNFRDVMVAMGQIPDKLFGFEASGIITRIGKDVKQFQIGDAVCTLGHGAHRAFFRNKAIFCQLIPEGISFEEAATMPLVHCTAYYALVHIARAEAGQSILIHAAAGGVGQAAIQIAKHFGMEIFATVGSPNKKALIRDVYGIQEDHIFNSRDLSFQRGVMRMTNGRGVDCVLNSLSGEALRQSWYCVAPFGTFVEIGIKDILGNTGLDMRPFLQDATFAFLNLEHVTRRRPQLMAKIIEGAFGYLRDGITKPVSPLTVYSVSEMENAFRLMQTGKHVGKIAISFGEHDIVPVLRQNSRILQLDEKATYVLVGGLGGLGRSLSTLLMAHGARNLCFISRSGANSEKAKSLIQELEVAGVKTKAYCCDVADHNSLQQTLALCSNEMPKIKGVIQCAMVLRDGLFENLLYQEWIDSTRPKVQGSWNLHSLLPEQMDFFVTLSSFAGVFGNRGQSNYAAAGSYQDALAFYRRSKGLKAVTVDLGIMRDVGVIAEMGATGNLSEWEEPFGIREYEFHALLKEILADQVSERSELPPQIVTGLATGGSASAAGVRSLFYFDDARFSILKNTGLQDIGAVLSADGTVPVKTQFAKVTSIDEASKIVTGAVVTKVAKSLQTEESEIDIGRPLHSYGVDSLVAVEIRNWIFKEIKAEVTVFDILSAVPITVLSHAIATKSKLLPEVLII